jgi:hypothetical protein
VLALLSDGVSRNRKAIVAALATRHAKIDVEHTLLRLAVTGQLLDVGHKFTLAAKYGCVAA